MIHYGESGSYFKLGRGDELLIYQLQLFKETFYRQQFKYLLQSIEYLWLHWYDNNRNMLNNYRRAERREVGAKSCKLLKLNINRSQL